MLIPREATLLRAVLNLEPRYSVSFLVYRGNISVIHFFDGLACIDYILKSSQDRQMFLLTDYELINQSVNGLDVIENTKIERAILVTSYDEDARLIQRALALNKKILPKPLLAYATINIV